MTKISEEARRRMVGAASGALIGFIVFSGTGLAIAGTAIPGVYVGIPIGLLIGFLAVPDAIRIWRWVTRRNGN